ncbi:MAG: 50S ribosomal protein L25/general stress protein Ctc [Pseudomonadota bacterium]
MSTNFEVNAEVRTVVGKGASRRLRRAERVPAILYGGNEEPLMLTLDHNEFIHSLEEEAFYSHVLTINIDGKAHQAILKDLQRHPYKPKVVHADFLRVSATEKLHTNVPLHFLNEDSAKGVKTGGGSIHHLMNDVEITCLPKDLPEFIEVDVKDVDVNQVIHLSDLTLPEGVSLVALVQGSDHDHPVVQITRRGGAAEESSEEDSSES